MEMFYVDGNGTPRDTALWDEILGEDSDMTWDMAQWERFPNAMDPQALWDRLLADARRLGPELIPEATSRERSYMKSYDAFVAFLEREGDLTTQDVIIGANFTYGWMPRVVILDDRYLDGARDALNAARKGSPPTAETVVAVARYFGGSLVAASKLLHFAAPGRYAIWDAKVARYLGLSRIDRDLESGVVTYLAYLAVLQSLLGYPEAATFRQLLDDMGVRSASPLRGLEMVMFRASEKGTRSKRKVGRQKEKQRKSARERTEDRG